MSKPQDSTIRIALVGACGRMGQEIVRALTNDPQLHLTLAIDRTHRGESLRDVIGPSAPDLLIVDKVGQALDAEDVHVLLDFTHPSSAAGHALSALTRGVAPIVGTSGLSQSDLREIADESKGSQTPALVVPNFAIGAVLMMKFAAQAARWMPNVEIIERHHDGKADAPSGTAVHTAHLIAESRLQDPDKRHDLIKTEGVRGGSVRDVPIHSVRLPGLAAHQEVMFGARGELLTIRHDTLDRTCFMEGVKLCARRVWSLSGLTVGLDALLD